MSFGTPPPPPRYRQPFDPLDWASKNPRRVFSLVWGGAVAILVIWGLLTSFYTVDTNEEAVVLRFGAYHVTEGPGFHGMLPFGIDRVQKGEVKKVHSEEFGYRTVHAGVQSQFDYRSRDAVEEANMLTGDLNLVVVNWEVRYRIKDLKNYLFEVRGPVITLRDVSQSVMRTAVGDRSVDEVLVLDRIAVQNEVQEKMQLWLDDLACGILIEKVNLKRLDAPEPVRDAFNAVEEAKQTKNRIINDAEGQRNKKIPAARGEAERLVKEAEGYKIGRVNRAEGDANAFLAVFAAYEKATDVTRRRLYFEAMEELLPRLDITLIDGDAAGVLKLLDLGRKGGD